MEAVTSVAGPVEEAFQQQAPQQLNVLIIKKNSEMSSHPSSKLTGHTHKEKKKIKRDEQTGDSH